jgi:hypothetical protein
VHPEVAALAVEEKGLLLGALLARMPPEAVAARLGGGSGTRCRDALEAVRLETRADRAGVLAALIALVRAPIPGGVERIHPGWIAERLAPESSAVVWAVAEGLPVEVRRVAEEILRGRGEDPPSRSPAIGSAGIADLRRVVFGGLVPLAGPGLPPGPQAQALVELPFAALEETIEARGAETLGISLRGAPPPVVARAAAGLAGRLGRVVLDAAAQPGPVEAREAARRLIAETALQKPSGGEMAWTLGARALTARLADEGEAALQAVAQRMPPARGRRWLAFARQALG